jgi:hypothetical protein
LPPTAKVKLPAAKRKSLPAAQTGALRGWARELADGTGEGTKVGSLSSPSLCFSFFLRFSACCKLKFSVFRVFHTNVANGSHECFKEILDVAIFRVENRQFLSRSVPTVFLHYAFVPVFTEL